MFKKITMILILIACSIGITFADVYIKNIDDTNVEIKFTVRNDNVPELYVIGTLNDWKEPGIPMVKNADGLWEVTVTAKKTDDIRYKYFYAGSYIFDFKAPDKIDDGFGAFNGRIEVGAVLTKQEADALTASGNTEAAASLLASASSGPKITYTTWTMFGFKTDFITQSYADPSKKGLDAERVGFQAKSYNKFSGELLPGMPFYLEIALFEDTVPALWARDKAGKVTTELADSLSAMFLGLLSDPISYINSEKKDGAYLGHLRFGFDSDYLNWQTGFKYAKLPKNQNIMWITVDGDWDAGYDAVGGFSQFSLGKKLQTIGDIKLNAVFAPNKSADRAGKNYGVYSYVNADWNGIKAEIQYNAKFANGTLKTLFDKVDEQDIILGAIVPIEQFTLKAQTLFNIFDSTDFKFAKNFAGEFRAGYADVFDFFGVEGIYRFRGIDTTMLYVKQADDVEHINDNLGTAGKQSIALNGYVNPLDFLKVGIDTKITLAAEKISGSSKELYFKPYADITLTDLIGLDSTVSVYGKMKCNLKDGDKFSASDSAFLFSEAGVKLSFAGLGDVVSELDVRYGLDNRSKDKMFNTVLASASLPNNVTADLGIGIRTVKSWAAAAVKDANNVFGGYIGAAWKMPVAKKPILYGGFVYNMDPYKDFGDGQNILKLDGCVIDRGDDTVNFMDGKASFRMGIRWDF